MISQEECPVEWALLVQELEDAKEHLASLVDQMANKGGIDEEDFAVQIGHVYAHLNRSWNGRDFLGEGSDSDHQRQSKFPDDLEPIG